MNSPNVYIEIGQSSLNVLKGDDGLELPIERGLNGKLSDACREKLAGSLRDFLQKKSLRTVGAYCAVGARGVTLRRLSIPKASKEELHRVLHLEIESEFPLAPDELAWGYRVLESGGLTDESGNARQEVLVAAVRKDTIEEYSNLLSSLGLAPVFTVGAFARACICPSSFAAHAVLEIGRCQSELISFEGDTPVAVRILPWGGENVTRAIEEKLLVSHKQAEDLKIAFDTAAPNTSPALHNAINTALESLAGCIDPKWVGRTLYLSGKTARYKDFAIGLAKQLRGNITCERLNLPTGPARSSAILGLKQWREVETHAPVITLQAEEKVVDETTSRPAFLKWAIVAGVLVLGLIALPYVQAIVLKPRLAKRLAAVKADTSRLVMIDRELSFLQSLKKTQPPYVDALYVIASASPSGFRLESVNMGRRGDVNLRGTMQNGQQVTDFRAKMLASGVFSNVVVEEQIPTPDKQKVHIRITAQWKPEAARDIIAAAEAKANAAQAKGTSSPGTNLKAEAPAPAK